MTAVAGRVAILGTGLLGGSLAAALKRHRIAGRIIGHAAGGDAARALALGLIDEQADSAEAAVAGADLVVLAAPVSVNCDLIGRIGPSLADGALLTDVSSVKGPVVAVARARLDARLPDFVPSHPIAGSERSGPDAADAGLFDRRTVVLSPLPESSPAQVARLDAIWRALGAKTVRLAVADHDRVYALVSHWPHALAFAMAAAVAADPIGSGGPAAGQLIGQGLLDLTRTAASSPELWADILLQNAEQSLIAAAQVGRQTSRIEAAIRAGDRATLVRLFGTAADWRRSAG